MLRVRAHLREGNQVLNMYSKKSRTVNLWIARSHQLAGQIVGMQLSIANVLALVVSAASVVAGATLLAIQQFPTAWPLWLAAGGIGTGLAFLIEGLTLSALIRIRVAGREIREREASLMKERNAHLKALAFPHPTSAAYLELIKRYNTARKMIERDYWQACRQQTRLARRDRRNSFLQAGGGCIASMCAGGLFYHAILSNLGQVISIVLSAVFTLAVTGTFISSEVFKDLQEHAIREAFANGNLAESAMRQETRMQSLWAVYQQTSHFFQSSDAQRIIADGGKLLVTRILEDLHQDLHHALVPEKQAPSAITPAEAPITQPVELLADTGQGYTRFNSPRRDLQGQAMHEQTAGDDRSQAILSSDAEGQASERETGTTSTLPWRATSVLPEEPGREKEAEKQLDAIGRAMLSLFNRLAPEEQKTFLNLAQVSPTEAVRELQERYPGYARFFTEERIAGIVRAIAQQDVYNNTSEKQVSSHEDPSPGPAQQEPGYNPQQTNLQALSDDVEGKLESNSVHTLEGEATQGPARPREAGKREKHQASRPFRRQRSLQRERIKTVMLQAQKSGQPLTYREIASAAEVGYSTVKKHARAIRKEIQHTEE